MRRSTSLCVIPWMACAAALSPASPAASATDAPATRTVRFHDLDLTHSEGVATLYARIRSAANEVCDGPDSQLPAAWTRVLHCRREAIDRAIAQVHSAALSSFHMSTTNQTQGPFAE